MLQTYPTHCPSLFIAKLVPVFFGKLIGGLLGLATGKLPLAILGVVIGHVFDKGLMSAFQAAPALNAAGRETFFATSFLMLGHLAKADGRVSEAEIATTEALMAHLGVTGPDRERAIGLFRQGAGTDFHADIVMAKFVRDCGRDRNLVTLLFEFLVNVALADGTLHAAEESVLKRTGQTLRLDPRAVEQLIGMIKAQYSFRGGGTRGSRPQRGRDLELAYQALGVDSSASDQEVKRAYRRLMSQHHPDKLIARGVPDHMVKTATEQAQEIQAAYDTITQARGRRAA